MDDLSILALRLQELRKKLNMSQSEFADSLSLRKQTYCAYEKMINKPPIDVLIKIAEKYDVSLDWLCGITDSEGRNKISLNTNSDVLNLIFELSMLDGAALDDDFHKVKEEPFQGIPDINRQYSSFMMLYFDDITINDTLKEWKKILNLYKNGVIDEDFCRLWTEKRLKQYNSSYYNPSKNVWAHHHPDDISEI